MGALIQTKGTQWLARFFNQRFDAGSIATTRAVQNLIGGTATSLKVAFAAAFDSTPLLTISDAFIAQYASANPTWYNNGRDALYPSTTLIAQAVAGSQITFNNPPGGWPNSIPIGVASPNITAADLEPGKGLAIPKGATVTAVSPAGNQTVVTFLNPVPNDRNQ